MAPLNYKIRDLRKKDQFIIDDAYLNGYAKVFGPSITAVYLSLCRRANKEQASWPSEATIGKDHDITSRTVRTCIKALERANLIKVEKKKYRSGRWPHNVYYLLDKSEWKKPEEIISASDHRKIKAVAEEKQYNNDSRQFPLKDAQDKETHKKDIDPEINKNLPVSVKGFIPKNREESICLDIAKKLGEEDMRFILSRQRRFGIELIERAYGIVKEDMQRKKINNPRSYFNAVVRKLVEEIELSRKTRTKNP